MRSVSSGPDPTPPTDDRTAKARIRDAAIECFAEFGVAATTARKVATIAGVSPGLVIHHFGSMDGLRTACDEHVATAIRLVKQGAMTAGPGLDVFGVMRETNIGSIAGYLARVLSDDSPTVARLVDDLVTDAETYLEQGIDSGMLRPSSNPRGRAVVLLLWTLGALVLHEHLERLLGVDLTDPALGQSPAVAAYLEPAYEILGSGMFTEDFMTSFYDSLASAWARDATTDAAPPPPGDAPTGPEMKGT